MKKEDGSIVETSLISEVSRLRLGNKKEGVSRLRHPPVKPENSKTGSLVFYKQPTQQRPSCTLHDTRCFRQRQSDAPAGCLNWTGTMY
jgi:hypothetical protein